MQRPSDRAHSPWPVLQPYSAWAPTCDTLHAHCQVLGKLAVSLAPPEPELQHAALRVTARGWETPPLPAPDRSGSLVAVLDLRHHEIVVEHSEGESGRIPLTPDRSVGEVTVEVLEAVSEMVGPVRITMSPQETPWTVPLDEDDQHRTYDPEAVSQYFQAASRVALALAELRAPYRGRSTPVNAWWGSFDLAVSFYSGRPARPPSEDFITRNSADAQQIEVGWWPGDHRYPRPAFFGFAVPHPVGLDRATLAPLQTRWNTDLGEYILDWDDVILTDDPHQTILEFGRSLLTHACAVCDWDPGLSASARGDTPPVY